MSAAILARAAAKAAAPLVKWTGLGEVLGLAITTAVVIGGGFSLGLAALDVYARGREAQQPKAGRAAVAPPPVRYASLAVAILLFAVCAAAVVIGLIEAPSSK